MKRIELLTSILCNYVQQVYLCTSFNFIESFLLNNNRKNWAIFVFVVFCTPPKTNWGKGGS